MPLGLRTTSAYYEMCLPSRAPIKLTAVNFQQKRFASVYTAIPAEQKESAWGKTIARSTPPSNRPSTGLERLPTSWILRNLLLGLTFSFPILFRPGFYMIQKVANSRSRLLNPDTNPLLRAIIKPFVYDQFCAGTNKAEICKNRDTMKGMGFAGVILCYGKEIQVSKSNEMRSTGATNTDQLTEVDLWRDGNLQTLDMVGSGDWLGIKLSGAGTEITSALMNKEAPSPQFTAAFDAICQKAAGQNCRIWIDAEQQVLQTSIDKWTIDFMRKYNRNGKALVYNTIQSYLKASRPKLQYQLELSHKEGWTLAVKLVRGAYINNDQRELIHDTKEDTDRSYNSIVQDLLSGTNLGFTESTVPKIQLFLAGHNPQSLSKALDKIQTLNKEGKLKVVPDFGQLHGMADGLGCKFLQQCEDLERATGAAMPRIYKCLTWGSIQECMQFLVRRFVENRGGADRMRDGLREYFSELNRRVVASVWRR